MSTDKPRAIKPRLLIIGAGLSGLYLASELQKHYAISILEADANIGGRILTCKGHDLGPSWIWPHHQRLLSLANRLKLTTFAQYDEGDALYQTPQSIQRYKAPPSLNPYRLQGGIASLIKALESTLEDVNVQTNRVVTQITKDADVLHVSTKEHSYQADKIIITASPRSALHINFTPTLNDETYQLLDAQHTWMGNSRKVVITYKEAFWREYGLSGFVFSSSGICSEIHDASTDTEAALFGFVRSGVEDEDIEVAVILQLTAIFGKHASEYVHFYDKNWRKAVYISTKKDHVMRDHPRYGHKASHFDDRLYFCSSEAAYENGGYLEGAIEAADSLIKTLL